jgi:hypothetical protein
MLTLEVLNRVVGKRPDELELGSVVLELLEETLTVRELITRTVEEQVHDLLLNRKLDAEQASRILDRHYLTEAEANSLAARGAIRYPAEKPQRRIDSQAEVRKALHAFQQGAYLVIVDGHQVDGLDEVLRLSATSKITFLRLTPLVGG